MGQKVHPVGFRLGISADWNARWYASPRDYAEMLNRDLEVREFLWQRLAKMSVSRIQMERPSGGFWVTVYTARPGLVIGKKGEDIERLKNDLVKRFAIPVNNIRINVVEIRSPELDAKLVADSVAQQLEKRIMFRRAMKRAVGNAMRLGALGIKINVAGRLNGAEIARREWYLEGRVPLHTLRADINYGFAEARTTYGVIGVKVWIYKGDVFDFEERRSRSGAGAKS